MKGLCILGATGSIGVSTLDVAARHPHLYNVIALTANFNIDALYEQCLEHRPQYAVVVNEGKAQQFKDKISDSPISDTKVLTGANALEEVATLDEVDSVMAAIVGAAGLLPSLAAAKAGKNRAASQQRSAGHVWRYFYGCRFVVWRAFTAYRQRT